MSWTTPSTRVTGDLITASIYNADIINNLIALSAGARVFHSVNQSIATATLTALAFDSERYDTDTIHDTVTNNSRLTCKTAGKYSIHGNATWAANATNERDLQIRLNGATVIAANVHTVVSAVAFAMIVSCEYALAVNDYVELIAFQNSGGAVNVNAVPNSSPEFSMHFLGG